MDLNCACAKYNNSVISRGIRYEHSAQFNDIVAQYTKSADTWYYNNVIVTSKRRCDVVLV